MIIYLYYRNRRINLAYVIHAMLVRPKFLCLINCPNNSMHMILILILIFLTKIKSQHNTAHDWAHKILFPKL